MNASKLLLLISIMTVIVMGYVHVAHFFLQEWRQLEPEYKDFIPMAGLSVCGLVLVAVRDKKGANKHLLTSLEVLIIIAVPSIAGLRFLMDTQIGQYFFAGGVVLFSVLWFVYFGMMKKGKNEEEIQFIKKSRSTITLVFATLLGYGLASFWMIHTLQKIPVN